MYETDHKSIEKITFDRIKAITKKKQNTRFGGSNVSRVIKHMSEKGVIDENEEAYVFNEVLKENGY